MKHYTSKPKNRGNYVKLPVPPSLFPLTYTNGPGLRYVIWVQGCSIRCCPRCLNPELQDPDGGIFIKAEELLEHIRQLKNKFSIEGVTFLGGEPTDQPAALGRVAQEVQGFGLSVMTYTGYPAEILWERMNKDKALAVLLGCTDILVDGHYNPHLDQPGVLWRGSINQRILLLSCRYNVEGLKRTIRFTCQYIGGKIDTIDNYFGNTLFRYHWLEPMPSLHVEELHKLPQENEVIFLEGDDGSMEGISWIPECCGSGSSVGSLNAPKGICGVLDSDSNIHLYGFQKPDVVENFRRALEDQGIGLSFEEVVYA